MRLQSFGYFFASLCFLFTHKATIHTTYLYNWDIVIPPWSNNIIIIYTII